MRGDDNQQDGMFSYISPEKRVPADHPLRPVRKIVDDSEGDVAEVCGVVLQSGAPIDRAGAIVEVAAVADLLFGAQ